MRKLNINTIFKSEIEAHITSSEKFLESDFENFNKFVNTLITALKRGNKIILFGNGGSAADAQHIAAELVVKYKKKRKAIPAISLSTDTSALTAIGNDFNFNEIFSRQIESIGKPGDVALGITTSGKSKNIINGLKIGKKKKLITVLLTKENYPNKKELKKISNFILGVPAKETARIQELHILVGHIICQIIDEVF